MGTTAEFFFLRNDGRTPEEWRAAMEEAAIFRPREWRLPHFNHREIIRPDPVLACRGDAPWLPVFDETLDYFSADPSMMPLSEAFGVPSFAFALMDSDILFVTYCDAARGIDRSYICPNSPRTEEAYGFEGDGYIRSLPEFMLEFGDWARLRAAWEEEVVLADDRMNTLCEILGIRPIIFERDNIPEGYRAICLPQQKEQKPPDNIVYFNEIFGKGE